MRVALCTETFLPQVNGIVKVICRTLEHLHACKVEAAVIAPRESLNEYLGARVIKTPSIRNPFYPKGKLGVPTLHTFAQVKAFAPDVMHLFHPSFTALVGRQFADKLGVPTVASFHLDLSHAVNFYRFRPMGALIEHLIRWEFNRSALALAPSPLVQQQMRQLGIRNVDLWRRGVDADKFHPRYADPDMRHLMSNGHPGDHLLLYVGRLAPEKQVDQLRTILERVPGTRLAIVGTGALEAGLRRHFDGYPATFLGHLSGELLARAYASADVFVFPSAFESFGLVLLEALASGVPVVSTKVGGAPQVIKEGHSGYLFEVDDVEGLLDGVQRCLTTPATLAAMRRAARQDAECYAWSNIMDGLVRSYESVIRHGEVSQGEAASPVFTRA
jgi:glycosyltransferase involved in cell wall biosynthesis